MANLSDVFSQIANAIRNRLSSSSTMKPIEMSDNILQIGKFDTNAATADKIVDGYKAYVNGKNITGTFSEQQLTISRNGTYTADSGKYFNKIVVSVGSSTEFNILTTLANVTGSSTNPSTIGYGDVVTLTFTPNSGFELPSSVTVLNAQSTWSVENDVGTLVLSAATDDVSISIYGVARTYYTYITYNDITYKFWNSVNKSIAPSVNLEFIIGTDISNPAQYANLVGYLAGETIPTRTRVYNETSTKFNLDGARWTIDDIEYSTSGGTAAELGNVNNVANRDFYVTIVRFTKAPSTLYSTTLEIGEKSYASSHKNYAPDLEFTVVEIDGNIGIAFDNSSTPKILYSGTAVCQGISIEGNIYGVNDSDTIEGGVAENVTVVAEWIETNVTDQDVKPLVFVSDNGQDFQIFTRYGGIGNLSYGYEWQSGDGGTKETVYDDSTGENVDVSWFEYGMLRGSALTNALVSRNGKIFLRGNNAVLGYDGVNTRGIGIDFTQPVRAFGDACALLVPDKVIEKIEGRAFFGLFIDSENLRTPPRVPSPVLEDNAYQAMFYNCKNLELYSTSTIDHDREWRIPDKGNATIEGDPLNDMFAKTGGDVTEVAIQTTYYFSATGLKAATFNVNGTNCQADATTFGLLPGSTKTVTFTVVDGYEFVDKNLLVVITPTIPTLNATYTRLNESQMQIEIVVTEENSDVDYTISVTASPKTFTIIENLTNVVGSSDNPTTMKKDQALATLKYSPATGYDLPTSVDVVGATHKWTSTGTLTLTNATKNITITIDGTKQIPKLNTVTNATIDENTLTFETVENATSYDIYADSILLGNVTSNQ